MRACKKNMNNKTLLIILVIMIGVIVILAFNARDSSSNETPDVNSDSGISLSTNPDPLQPGPATFLIDVKDKSGTPVDNAKVYFDLDMTTMNMGTQQGEATAQGNGRYSAQGRMTMRGPWRVSIKATMPDGSVENKDFTVDVP